MFILRSLLAATLLMLAAAAPAAELRGTARVVDGDTIALGGVNLRLFGIDAPERSQTCEKNGFSWACGGFARATLQALAAGGEVQCRVVDTADKHGRPVVTCAVAGADLARDMVKAGAAVAYLRYSRHYAADEAQARAARTGIWAGRMVAPEDYRHRDIAPIGACRIKGNIGTSGRIFHSPGQRDYTRTKINPATGEAWFCTAAEAKTAGFRAAQR
jgi:endonuclease YncB( thermonuclease family)